MANRTGHSAILNWLGFGPPGTGTSPPGRDGEAADVESVRIIVTELDKLPADEARFIAAFAYLLSRVARADLQTSDVETARMEEVVMTHGRLPRAQAMLVVASAKMQNRLLGGSENYLVAREFDQMATVEQKRDLLRCLFEVAAADHDVSVVEENEIRRISRELHLEHDDYISARSEFRDDLAVLKKKSDEA
ncbi:MAG TPA: TerB family tellurite resistance protein [Candidatus Polarisedimenticolia bacterium]|jgi:uncharacterized tellurite resistance protein B-like protein|nr:TerB family tellurite resistance protein [Candidatus Polarisedimenticolia bacterium]